MKMRQTTTATEKIDPLMRIQEEIKEVKRREKEYRQLKLGDYDEHAADANSGINHVNNNNELLSMSPEPPSTNQNGSTVTLLSAPDDNSSLASSVNSKESLEEHNSDDSGISASSSPVNGSSANGPKLTSLACVKEQRYVGPNTYNLIPVPPPQKMLTRTVSTPQIFTQNRIIAQSPAQKGLMQRFIASRGKLVLNNNNYNNNIGAGGQGNPYYNDNNTKLLAVTSSQSIINNGILQDYGLRNPASMIIPTVTMTPPVIERDADGKPIRRGYVPVEVKIQRELKDYKSRESELKKYRKIRDSTPDLLDSIDMETVESDEDDDEEHCYGPGKLRSAKSIGELCDSNNSISPRTTPSPDYDNKINFSRSVGMRPAMSLAQLCDLDPEEAPSSHRLIAQWESIIKKNEKKCERK